MRTLVYAHRDRAEQALALVADLRDGGGSAFYRDTRAFNGDVERCDRVVTDDPVVAEAHEARGIEVAPFSGSRPASIPADVPVPEPAYADEGGDPVSEAPAGEHTVEETSPGWWKLLGPDGEQIGKSVRSEEDAWALLEADG